MRTFKLLASKQRAFLSILLITALFGAELAMAGTGGTEFAAIYTKMLGWAQGSLGKVIAIAAFIVGLAGGIIQQSIAAVVVGVGMSLALYFGPSVITGILTAVI